MYHPRCFACAEGSAEDRRKRVRPDGSHCGGDTAITFTGTVGFTSTDRATHLPAAYSYVGAKASDVFVSAPFAEGHLDAVDVVGAHVVQQ